MRGGIAERGGIRVGHRIIEINGQSVVATPHEKIIHILSSAVGEVKTCSHRYDFTQTVYTSKFSKAKYMNTCLCNLNSCKNKHFVFLTDSSEDYANINIPSPDWTRSARIPLSSEAPLTFSSPHATFNKIYISIFKKMKWNGTGRRE